jgi:UDP-glucuronate 4-epimerase
MRTVVVTGCAGFIGFHASKALLERGDQVIGIDNLNPYYDVQLKEARLASLASFPLFKFYKGDIADQRFIAELFQECNHATHILHLAAQAGVRYSLVDPYSYAHSNLIGHLTILEALKSLTHLEHFVYASSSSVYGRNQKLPFAIDDPVNDPISLYAASKRSCELMSQCYSHLFGIPQTGLRFFTAYGPWGRPDMAAFLFTKGILQGEEITVYNNGHMSRNFTYIDDIVVGTLACLDSPPSKSQPGINRLYNIANNQTVPLMDFIQALERILQKSAKIRFAPIQPGDVKETLADISATQRDFHFQPRTPLKEGLEKFVDWYQGFYDKRPL